MRAKPQIAIVGPGRLGSALASQLDRAGYRVRQIVPGQSRSSNRKAAALARSIGASVVSPTEVTADLVWITVPDRQIHRAAEDLARKNHWKGRLVFHASGALPSDELNALRRRGAAVAAVHPFMTFISGVVPSLEGVAFGIEGDSRAVTAARAVVRSLGGVSFPIKKKDKAAYHAWGGFSSPLLIALLLTGERVAGEAGVSPIEARKKMMPILRQTLDNYEQFGAELAFTGPIVRGDTKVVRKHLALLRKIPEAREVYVALARAALKNLPISNRKELERLLSR